MPTKRSATSCKVPTGRKPTKATYLREFRESLASEESLAEVALPLKRMARVGAGAPLPSAHAWPTYGEKCWRQVYAEMQAVNALVYALRLDAYCSTASSIPQAFRDAALTALVAAKMNYSLAWQVMEDCVVGVMV